jgi:prepilin peptidase dependent protein B
VLAQRQRVVIPELRFMRALRPPRLARGVSLVELMVGLAIGLFIVAGTLTMFANQVGSSKKLLQQARLHQEMRSAMDLVTRDLRRAGAWDNAVLGTVAIGPTSATVPNDYRLIDFDKDADPERIEYHFTRDAASTIRVTENNTRDSDEWFGFRHQGDGVLRMRLGKDTGFQPLTDPAVIRVQSFTITDGSQTVPLIDACRGGCTGSTCPSMVVRQFTLTLVAALANDSTVSRTLTTTVRPRNDRIEGTCP